METVLPIEAIEPDPGQPRKNFDPVKMQELTDGIRNSGFRNHKRVAVRRNGNGDNGGAEKFLIVNGERRYRAALKAGVREIPVDILEFADTPEGARDCFIEQFVDNYVRDGFDTIEAIEAMHKTVTQMGASVEWLAKVTGKSVAGIKADLPLATLPPDVKKLIDSGEVFKETARELATFPDNQVYTALKWAMLGGSPTTKEGKPANKTKKRTVRGQLAGIAAYRQANGQGSLDFGLVAKEAKDSGDLRVAKDAWEKFEKAWGRKVTTSGGKHPTFIEFVGTHHATIVLAKNRQINALEQTAMDMEKIAKKILSSCGTYRAQRGLQKAA